jgi:hypothetical protein
VIVSGSLQAMVRYAAMAILSGVVALAMFVVLDPFLTAHPKRPTSGHLAKIDEMGMVSRANLMTRLRLDVAAGQKERFAHNAMNSAFDKLSTTAVQGFGRFGPLGPSRTDSEKRYDWVQDWGAVVWLPLVFSCCIWAGLEGRSQWKRGEPSTAWAVLLHLAIAIGVVTSYLPLAWDRYFLPIQAPSILLVSGGITALARRFLEVRAEPA